MVLMLTINNNFCSFKTNDTSFVDWEGGLSNLLVNKIKSIIALRILRVSLKFSDIFSKVQFLSKRYSYFLTD